MKLPFVLLVSLVLISSCTSSRKTSSSNSDMDIRSTVKLRSKKPAKVIDTKTVSADELMVFAESLQGVPYRYGSTDVKQGLDCSGFINHVFNHFGIKVPRSSSDFTNAGAEVTVRDSRRGDIILFTGSDPNSGIVGHMGLITENNSRNINFIHSASGGGRGVMISGMSEYFVKRFVKVIRIFPDQQ